ncbi:MAG: Ig-like domain-containing protein [Candidatus Zixiibacteriota bacterium]
MSQRISRSLILLFTIILLILACSKKKEPVSPPTDNTPPEVLSTYPENGQTAVSVADSLVVVLSEPIVCSSIGTSVIYLNPTAVGISICSQDTIVFTPSEELRHNTTYTATVSSTIQDEAGNRPSEEYQWTFTTGHASPGVSWTEHQLILSKSLCDIAYSGSAFVAVGISGQVVRSTDGDSWQVIETPAVGDLHKIIWADTIFVAVGDAEFIMTSPDGIEWTVRRTGHVARSMNAVVFTGNMYVAVGGHYVTDGSMLADVRTSADAIKWNPESIEQVGSMSSVVWTGDRFIASGFQVPGLVYAIWTSETGQDWVLKHTTTASAAHYEDVAWSGDVAIAIGFDPSELLFSSDGLQWNSRVLSQNHQSRAIEWTGSQFVAVGHFGNIFTSPDGDTWTRRESGVLTDLYGVWGSTERIAAVGGSTVLTSP